MNASRYGLCTILAVLAVFSTVSAIQGGIPDLVGNWTGTSVGHMNNGGYDKPSEFSYRLYIKEQTERSFNGSIYTTVKGKTHSIGFSGAIGRDMKSFYLPLPYFEWVTIS